MPALRDSALFVVNVMHNEAKRDLKQKETSEALNIGVNFLLVPNI